MPVLYRTYRPQRFADVAGQERVIELLTLQLKRGKFHHGFLFAGPKGVGKTSVARIFAKALNCPHRKSYEPCNRCTSCREITQGVSLIVSEIDGASHRGIDEIRALKESVSVAWKTTFTRVVIIDEAHMLTKEAANALLKLLEEPPPRLIFILATTEFSKLPETLLSRLARLHFRRLSVAEIEPVLKAVVKAEGRSLDSAVGQRLAELAEGSLRDGLNLLEALLVTPGRITLQVVNLRLGLLPEEVVEGILDRVMSADAFGAIALLKQSKERGDHRRQIIQLLTHVRDRLFRSDPKYVTHLRRSVRLMQLLLVAERLAKFTPIQALPLELALIEASLLFRSQETTVAKGEPAPPKETPVLPVKSQVAKPVSAEMSLKLPERFKALVSAIGQHNHALALLLRESAVEDERVETGRIVLRLRVRFAFHQERLLELKHRRLIEAALEELYGETATLEVRVGESIPAADASTLPFEEALRVFSEDVE